MPGTRFQKRHRNNVRFFGLAATGIEHGGWYCPMAVVGYSGIFPLFFFPSLQNAIYDAVAHSSKHTLLLGSGSRVAKKHIDWPG